MGVIEKYVGRLLKVAGIPEGEYVYRGQENAEWPLHSAATRRLVKAHGREILHSLDFPNKYVTYHRNVLIEPARTRGFGIEDGREISDLQLLAKLQHFGAATGLLDFTWSPLVALWFASHDVTGDGKIFIINSKDVKVTRVSSDESQQNLETIFSGVNNRGILSYWQPMGTGEAMTRILGQRSLFILGHPLIPKNSPVIEELTIKKDDKESLIRELSRLDIDETSIFQDIYGFSKANSVQSSIIPISELTSDLVGSDQVYEEGPCQETSVIYTNPTTSVSSPFESYFWLEMRRPMLASMLRRSTTMITRSG